MNDLLLQLELDERDLVFCKCGVNEDDGVMVQCDICGVWQHQVMRISVFIDRLTIINQFIIINCRRSAPSSTIRR